MDWTDDLPISRGKKSETAYWVSDDVTWELTLFWEVVRIMNVVSNDSSFELENYVFRSTVFHHQSFRNSVAFRFIRSWCNF